MGLRLIRGIGKHITNHLLELVQLLRVNGGSLESAPATIDVLDSTAMMYKDTFVCVKVLLHQVNAGKRDTDGTPRACRSTCGCCASWKFPPLGAVVGTK